MKYYLYIHIRLDKNEPFYVGIAKKYKRNPYERAFTKSGRNEIWNRIVNKTNYKVDIIFETDDWNSLNNKEIEYITLYGRINIKTGILANMTDGGEGTFDKGGEIGKKIGNKLRGVKKSAEHRAKCIVNLEKGRLKEFYTNERKEKISESRIGSKNWMYGRKNEKHHNSKPVIQFSLDGKFISRFASAREAERETGESYKKISETCINKYKSKKGFIWRFEN